jgi:hypothetical protein
VIGRAMRLTYRINRFEIVAMTVFAVLLVLVSFVVAWVLSAVLPTTNCVPSPTGQYIGGCAVLAFVATLSGPAGTLSVLFPGIAGLILGTPVISREVERGTTSLAWSLGPSRWTWFLQRVIPMAIVAFVLALCVGWAVETVLHAMSPEVDLGASFSGFRGRGVLLGTEALVFFSVGALLGRSVPTLLLALILGVGVLVAVGNVHRSVLVGEAELREQSGFTEQNVDLYLDSRFRLPDGRLGTYEELIAVNPGAFEMEAPPSTVFLLIPGTRYRSVEAREALGELAIAAVFLVLAAVIVSRRRPT